MAGLLARRSSRCSGIHAKSKRKFKATTDSNHRLPVADNLLNREFARPTGRNQMWLSDITYIDTEEGWLYLAAVEDLFTRKIVGWSMPSRMTSDLVGNALQMAVQRELPEAGLLCHSDRGSQYASRSYQQQLARHGITCSMSRRGDCWDNAPMESFFATLKKELIHHERYATRQQARQRIFEYIEVFYNRVRRHSGLGYMSPAEFDRAA